MRKALNQIPAQLGEKPKQMLSKSCEPKLQGFGTTGKQPTPGTSCGGVQQCRYSPLLGQDFTGKRRLHLHAVLNCETQTNIASEKSLIHLELGKSNVNLENPRVYAHRYRMVSLIALASKAKQLCIVGAPY